MRRGHGARGAPEANRAWVQWRELRTPLHFLKHSIAQLVSSGLALIHKVSALLPPAPQLDWSETLAATWRPDAGGGFVALDHLDPIHLDDLLQIDRQKAQLEANTAQFVAGHPANNALLWGARGTGKSSLIHALLNRHHQAGLRLVEVGKDALASLGQIAAALREAPQRFVIVCDDLSFQADDPHFKQFKSALEGSVLARGENVLIYATSNRRHLIPEPLHDNLDVTRRGGEIHQGEAVEEKISLSDRFGLWLAFHPFRQDEYLDVARHWLERLAQEHGSNCAWNEAARSAALQWALARGVRSGRAAHHFARHWVGQALLRGG